MKALEILKWLSTNESLSGVFHREALEAIAEIEALQAPKTCEWCRYNISLQEKLNSLSPHTSYIRKSYRYESKETK